ncbi:hypothetical protein Hanom_Chr04g00382931 [Helianthus anomalus]
MMNIPQYINLRHETLLQLLIQLSSNNLLNRNFRTMNPMPRMPHHRERTRPELLPYHIIPNRSSSIRRLTHHPNNFKTTNPNFKLVVVEVRKIQKSATVL